MACLPLKPQLGTSRGPRENDKGLNIAHLNAHGMAYNGKITDDKMTNIKNFAVMYGFDVLAISETWLGGVDPHDQKLQIEGYHSPERQDRPPGGNKENFGGLVVYVRECIDYELVSSNSYGDLEKLDEAAQNIQIVLRKISGRTIPCIYISALYIPSEQFTNLLDRLKDQSHHDNVVVLGDVNINQFIQTKRQTEAVRDAGFCQLINEITRPTSGTLIDHVYVKESQVGNMISDFGVIQCRISDHDLIFCTVSRDFLKQDLSSPSEMYKTILKDSGHTDAAHHLRDICAHMLNHMAAKEVLSDNFYDANIDDKKITNDDLKFIRNKYEQWYKTFWDELGANYLRHSNKIVLFKRADSELRFLWTALTMGKEGDSNINVPNAEFPDYEKWHAIVHGYTTRRDELQAHCEGDGRGAVAVHFRPMQDDGLCCLRNMYLAYYINQTSKESKIVCIHSGTEHTGLFTYEVEKVQCCNASFITVINHAADFLRDKLPSWFQVTGWEPLGNQYVLAKKLDLPDLDTVILENHELPRMKPAGISVSLLSGR